MILFENFNFSHQKVVQTMKKKPELDIEIGSDRVQFGSDLTKKFSDRIGSDLSAEKIVSDRIWMSRSEISSNKWTQK